ncbi:Serine palmitoyltransferase 1 (Long chain base biosynthesis protein 1) (LCB 1) (Serine-palmitoyl-CoA transferase 1) (SPT 1) (SPT1) [Durusdinium trenchii]|uniref:serine C-palmitoyltransferase n=1 Tax=Durusdinium trenchii TaxID=1381693 RepID=A0ABP0MF24_9DINO
MAAAKGADEFTVEIHIPQFVTNALDRVPFLTTYLKWWIELWRENPVHLLVETALIVLILYILLKRPSKKKSKLETLPPAMVQDLLNDFKPEPLCPELNPAAKQVLDDIVVLEEKAAKYTKVRGVDGKVLNCVTLDFLGLGQRKEITDAANAALDKYGCGSCGPRGFYGSIDVHVYLEQDLAKFFGTEEAIVYSDASSTASSAIPAFSNRADLLVVDDGCNESIMTGVNLSRSRVLFFKHNDMEDLARLLEKVADEDKRLKRSPQRRFIITEGLYRNFGDIAPVDEIVRLKHKYKWRLFLDESHALGVFGANGRGVHEHFGVEAKDIELLIASLSTTLSSVGGFCVGTREVVEHQRLSGAGYCFSASSPPFVSTAASAAIKVLDEEGRSKLMPTIKRNAQFFNAKVYELGAGLISPTSNPASALVHLRLAPEYRVCKDRADYTEASRCKEDKALREITRRMRDKGFLLTVANYIVPSDDAKVKVGSSEMPPLPPPSIRAVITALHTEDELTAVAQTLCDVTKQVVQELTLGPDAASAKSPSSSGVRKR